jgi:hypothetical protein
VGATKQVLTRGLRHAGLIVAELCIEFGDWWASQQSVIVELSNRLALSLPTKKFDEVVDWLLPLRPIDVSNS